MKNILFLILVLSVSLSCAKDHSASPGDQGTLTGVISIKDLYGQVLKADAGSEVYVIPATEAESIQTRDIGMVFGMFQRNKSIYLRSISTTADPAKTKKAKDNFDTLAVYARRYLDGFIHLPAAVKTAAGEAGNYSLNLEPGRYYILVISGNLKSDNLVERSGNIEFRTVEIRSSEEKRLDVTFEKQEQVWIRLVTDWPQEGC